MKKEKIAVVSAAAAGIAFEELYRYAFCRHKGSLSLLDKKTHSEDYYIRRDNYKAELLKKPYRKHEIKNARGKKLVGYYYCAGEKPCGKLAFIVHGYHSDAAEAAGPFADYYFSRGWDIFCCDHFAHGESEGELISWDYYESIDCLQWLGYLTRYYGNDIQVILHGFSMGGGTVVKMSDRLPGNVKFICCDSGLSDAEGLIKPKVKFLYQPLNRANKAITGFSLEDTDVRENLKNAKVPVLFVHGTDDPTVPFAMGKELYELCPTEKDCLFIEGGLHVEGIYAVREEYERKLDYFIEKYTEKAEKNEI